MTESNDIIVYICLDCGHEWDYSNEIECPNCGSCNIEVSYED